MPIHFRNNNTTAVTLRKLAAAELATTENNKSNRSLIHSLETSSSRKVNFMKKTEPSPGASRPRLAASLRASVHGKLQYQTSKSSLAGALPPPKLNNSVRRRQLKPYESLKKFQSVQSISIQTDGKVVVEKSPPPIKLKYDETTVEDGEYNHPLALDNFASAERKIDTQKSSSDEEVSFAWPLDMEFNSEIKFTEKNILAMEEYLQKAEVFHHLYQPLD